MLTHCAFCGDELIVEEVKTVKKGKCKQASCKLHGYMDADITALGKKHLALKKIFARYHHAAIAEPDINVSDIKEHFTEAEWEAIEGLKDE